MNHTKTDKKPIGSIATFLWHLDRADKESAKTARQYLFDNSESSVKLASAFNQIVRDDDVRDRAGNLVKITGSKIRNYRSDNLKGDQ